MRRSTTTTAASTSVAATASEVKYDALVRDLLALSEQVLERLLERRTKDIVGSVLSPLRIESVMPFLARILDFIPTTK